MGKRICRTLGVRREGRHNRIVVSSVIHKEWVDRDERSFSASQFIIFIQLCLFMNLLRAYFLIYKSAAQQVRE